MVGPGFLSGSNRQAGAIRSPSSSREAIHFQNQSFPEYDQKFVYLKDKDSEDFAEYSAQSKKVSMQPDWPQNPNLLTTPPVRMAAPTPIPPMRMHVTNQATIHNPGQSEMSGRDSADKNPVISQGSSGHEEGNPSRQSDHEGRMNHGHSDHMLPTHPGSKNMDGMGVSGRDHHAGVPRGNGLMSGAAMPGNYGQSMAGSSSGFGFSQSEEGSINGELESRKKSFGQSESRLISVQTWTGSHSVRDQVGRRSSGEYGQSRTESVSGQSESELLRA